MTDQPEPADAAEKLDLRSHDVVAEKRDELLRLFPEVRTEGGKLDFDRLRLALGEAVDVGRERYGLTWPGKAECFKTIQAPSLGTLRPMRDESVDFDTTENLIIEGDNLEVLKLLQKSYLGKVKMIYIDPPYNTGNDFIYPDNYTESLQTYLEYTGQVDAQGRKFGTNTEADGRFHSKWLNMMYPRLYLARNLLCEAGLIFVSIDDHEVMNLRRVMDEVFGEENFVGNAVWQKAYTANMTAQFISDTHDHVLIYARWAVAASLGRLDRTDEQEAKFKNPDNDPRGAWKAENLSAGKFYAAGLFEIVGPAGTGFRPPAGRYWRCSEPQYQEWLADGRITFGLDGTGRPMLKKFLAEVQEGLTPSTWWAHEECGSNKEASLELKELFDGDVCFDTPKPVRLLRRICDLGAGEEGLVLDFFAGSGSLAHAVLERNHESGTQNRFILVQLPEPLDREQYSSIAQVTRERVRRAIRKLVETGSGQLSLPPGPNQDRGFRAFVLAESNLRPWNANTPPDADTLRKQLELHVDHVVLGRTQEDILYEVLLKSGFPLTATVETLTIEGKTVYSVADGALLVCLERDLTLELIRALAERKPERVVCLDAGFAGNDPLKANAVKIFQAKDVKSFRTV